MPNGKSIVIQVPDFQRSDPGVISNEVDEVARDYDALTNDVVAQVESGGLSNDGLLYAIVLLGRLRAANAVTTLIKHIEFKPEKRDTAGGIGRWGPYPAQQALVKIGTPAVNMVLDKLSAEDADRRRELMCSVISDALGKEVADAMLRLRYAEEQDPALRENLAAAIRVMQKL